MPVVKMGCGHFMEKKELLSRPKIAAVRKLYSHPEQQPFAVRQLNKEMAGPCNECLILREANGL